MIIQRLGRTDYSQVYEAMRSFTAARQAATADELWLTEHAPVYTVGAAGRPEHLPGSGADARIAVQRIDRLVQPLLARRMLLEIVLGAVEQPQGRTDGIARELGQHDGVSCPA